MKWTMPATTTIFLTSGRVCESTRIRCGRTVATDRVKARAPGTDVAQVRRIGTLHKSGESGRMSRSE